MLVLHALSTRTLAQLAETSAAAPECFHGRVIEHSDRTVDNRCTGTLNDACDYQCQAGYIATGRHVCQLYEVGGAVFINHSFFGGSCRRLCTTTTQTCKAPQATIRTNATDAVGPCFATRCVADGDAALFNLLRGNLEVWRQARSDKSGFYKDSVNIIDPNTPTAAELAEPRTIESPTQELRVAVEAGNSQAATGVTGLGLITEVVALALGLQSTSDTIARVRLTLRSLVGKTPGVSVPRDPRGFFIHFMDADTGAAPRETTSCLMCTGLLMAGAFFLRDYIAKEAPQGSAEVIALVGELWDSVRFESILCANNALSPTGTGIPMTLSLSGDECGPAQEPQADGFYQFNEEHYTIWFAYEKACGGQVAGHCSDAAIEAMWEAWQGRRLHPNHAYERIALLSAWSGYIMHLPYYTTHTFNSDPAYLALFRNHWLADRAYFDTSDHASERGRYGLGAGPVAPWCSEGMGYLADRLNGGGKSHCRVYSPYITAGYLPAAPGPIRAHLLALLEDGESVVPVPSTDYVLLWRKSLLEPGWPSHMDGARARFTLVDLSSELLGLSTLFLPTGFYPNGTDYFRRGGRGRAEAKADAVSRAQRPLAAEQRLSPDDDAIGLAATAVGILVRVALCTVLLAGCSVATYVVLRRWRARHLYRSVK